MMVKKSQNGVGQLIFWFPKKWLGHMTHFLGGPSKQRVTYDQLSMTQFVQAFICNVLDAPSHEVREKMLWYLNELMEDSTDFSWASAKECHAILLCEMERGTLDWHNTNRIERIRRAHAQKHHQQSRQNWVKYSENQKKPWFCK